MIYLIGIAAFFSTALGGLFALRLKDRLHLILGFSAGAVIGVAFFDLMPEAFTLLSDGHTPSFTTAVIAFGFALYLVLDRIIVLHRDHHDHAGSAHTHHGLEAWGAGTLSIHSFLDGLGIGLAFHVSPTIGFVVAAAVLTHDFSDGINTVSMVVRHGGLRSRVLRWLFIDAIAPMLGILATLLFSVSEQQLGFLIAIFSGFFLYIGTSDLLPESHHGHPVLWTTFSTIIGMASLYAVVHLAG